MKHRLFNRIDKASKNKDGKKVVSKGVLSLVKEMQKTKFKKNSKSKYKALRKKFEEFGFEKIKIINKDIVSTVFEGQKLNAEQSLLKAREYGLVKPEQRKHCLKE